jgi:serine/threonine kinase 32
MGNTSGKPVVFTDEGMLDNLIALLRSNYFAIVNLNHFRLLRVVGKGAFGKVRIVERKDTGLTFALKYIRKDEGMSNINFLEGGETNEPNKFQWFARRVFVI